MRQSTARWLSFVVLYGMVLLTVVVAIGYDIWVIRHYGEEASISAVMRDLPDMMIFGTGFFLGGLIFGLAAHFWFGPPDGR